MTSPSRSGVFQQATDRRVERFTESISFDHRLYAHDIAGSIGHAQMLADQKEWFIRQARRDKVPEGDAERRLEELDQFLQLLDRAWMTASVDSSTLRISAGIDAEASVRPAVVK